MRKTRSGVRCDLVLVASGLLLAAVLPGQRVWVVDAAKGPGTNFTSLARCVATAADGEVIVVRAGSHGDTVGAERTGR